MNNKKYQIREDFFDEVNTEEKAYFLGFLYADGYNNENRGTVRLSLKQSDIEILQKLRNIIYLTERPLLFDKSKGEEFISCYLDICNNHISKRLAELGVTQAKTFTIRFPTWLTKDLYRHFIRGYFDGDGYVGFYKIQAKTCISQKSKFSIVSNTSFCQSLSVIIKSQFGFDCRIEDKKCASGNIKGVCLNGRLQIIKVLDWLYQDSSIHLERKFNKFQELKNYKPWKRK